MIKHFITLQFLLFVFVGATAAALHWLARFILSIWFPFPLAVALAYFVGIAVAFILNRRYVFPSSSKPVQKQACEFLITNIIFFPVVLGISIIIREGLIENGLILYVDGIAHGLAITIPIFMTFLIYKFITFGDK